LRQARSGVSIAELGEERAAFTRTPRIWGNTECLASRSSAKLNDLRDANTGPEGHVADLTIDTAMLQDVR